MRIRTQVRKLGDFVEAVAEIRFAWPRESWEELWFRGEGMDYRDTKLRPALYRPEGGGVMKPSSALIHDEDQQFKSFLDHSVEQARQNGGGEDAPDPWGTYFLMQHHGSPTRLLDWSNGALVALHFALREDHQEPCDRYVYVLDPYWMIDWIDIKTGDHMSVKQAWKDYCQKHVSRGLSQEDWDRSYLPDGDGHAELPLSPYPMVLNSERLSRRISAQRFQFILMGTDYSLFNEMLEEPGARLAAIAIPKDSVPGMRVALRDAGITESVIFPELDGHERESRQFETEKLLESS